ncbi:hypothetical protein BD309DRAFT_1064067, partial [Dichomitus squalens]
MQGDFLVYECADAPSSDMQWLSSLPTRPVPPRVRSFPCSRLHLSHSILPRPHILSRKLRWTAVALLPHRCCITFGRPCSSVRRATWRNGTDEPVPDILSPKASSAVYCRRMEASPGQRAWRTRTQASEDTSCSRTAVSCTSGRCTCMCPLTSMGRRHRPMDDADLPRALRPWGGRPGYSERPVACPSPSQRAQRPRAPGRAPPQSPWSHSSTSHFSANDGNW